MRKIIIILTFFAQIAFAQNSWDLFGNMPKPVAGGDIWQNDNNLYIVGGHSDSLQSDVNWVQKYNIDSGTWELDTMKSPRYGLVVQNYNSIAYFFGGIQDTIKSITNIESWGIDQSNQAILDSNGNFNRIFSTGQIVGDNFYIIGGNPLPGTSLDTLAYIIEYNLSQSKITYELDTLFTNEDFPDQQMSAVIGNDIYIFGGAINGISDAIYKFNTISHIYEKLPIKLLEPRAGGRAVLGAEGNLIYIIGGYNESSAALNSVEIFTVEGDQYSIASEAPIQEARYNFMAASYYGMIYIMGGYNEEGKVISSIERFIKDAATSTLEQNFEKVPTKFELKQNYPNPFNPTTTIRFSIPNIMNAKSSSTKITVYDILGNKITDLVNGTKSAGRYSVVFDASRLPSGVYYYQLTNGSFVQTKKMLLLK